MTMINITKASTNDSVTYRCSSGDTRLTRDYSIIHWDQA